MEGMLRDDGTSEGFICVCVMCVMCVCACVRVLSRGTGNYCKKGRDVTCAAVPLPVHRIVLPLNTCTIPLNTFISSRQSSEQQNVVMQVASSPSPSPPGRAQRPPRPLLCFE